MRVFFNGFQYGKREPRRKKTLLKLDTNGEGMNAIWKGYQFAALEYLIKNDEGTSAQILSYIVQWDAFKISRASVIQFMNRLVDAGLATYREESCKGGSRRVYALKDRTWDDFNTTIIDKILFKIWEIFPDNERIKQVMAK